VSSPLRYLRHFTAGSLLAVVVLAAALVVGDAGPGVWAAALVAYAVALVLFHHGLYATVTPWPHRLLPLGVVAAVVAYAGMVATGAEIWPSVVVPGVLIAAVLTGSDWPRRPLVAIGLTVTGICAVAATGRWWEAATAVLATGLCVAALMVQLWVWEIAARVGREGTRAAEAAVAGERQRFAADLHDIQGHSLQVIVLKSELAARLAGTDTARAAAEMRAVEELARAALRDTRQVAHGYRDVSLRTEIGNAVGVLAAAGVRCRTGPPAPPDLAPATERLLALLIREATTNVLRHSTATDAEIAMTATPTGIELAVRNDGPLPGGDDGGSGLGGLAQRFAAAGGTLRWGVREGRFAVEAELPR
jgi:two-component system sensor histidine kinase DesK